MNFLPYERFTIQSHYTPDQIRHKLSEQLEKVEALLSWMPVTTNKADGSSVEEYRFKTSPGSFRRRYRSTIRGKVLCEMGCTKIEVTLVPAAYIIFFMILTFGLFGFLWFLLFSEWISSIGTPYMFFPKHVLGIGGALVLGYAIFVGVVKFEAAEMKKYFRAFFGTSEK